MKTSLNDVRIINLPKIKDRRGNLSVIEGNTIPFEVKRVYYLYDVPAGAKRGGHAHIVQEELLIPLSGSFTVIVKDGKAEETCHLHMPDQGLYLPGGIWRELKDFSSGAVCLVLASGEFSEEDYIRSYPAYVKTKK